MFQDLVPDNLQENCYGQGFKEPIDEDQGKSLEDENEHVFQVEKMEKTFELNPEEDICSTEQNQSSICIQEFSAKVSIAVDSKGDIL